MNYFKYFDLVIYLVFNSKNNTMLFLFYNLQFNLKVLYINLYISYTFNNIRYCLVFEYYY